MTEAVLAGGFALGGVAMQQLLSLLGENRRSARERETQLRAEVHGAFVEMVKAGRRVQRALVDWGSSGQSEASFERLERELDQLTDAGVVVRFLVRDEQVVDAVAQFEECAKRLEDNTSAPGAKLRLGPLIDAMRSYEAGQTQELRRTATATRSSPSAS